jgi:perosamine synthetase
MYLELKKLTVQHSEDLRCALKVIDNNAQGVCFILDGNKVVGVLTDGDIRRALINNIELTQNVAKVMKKKFTWLGCQASTNEIQSTLSEHIKYVPLLNSKHELVDFACAHHYRNIPVAQPELNGNELAYVTDCIKTGWVSSKGKYVKQFEDDFARYIKSSSAIAVSNGTVALHLTLVALGVGPGDEVLIPDLTFAATANAVLYVGAIPVLVDIDPQTLCIDPLKARAAVTSKSRAIIPVHLYGHPADMDAISTLARDYDLLVIEDCAEALGTLFHGRHVGTFGDASIFSFFGNKTITTGEGGMAVFDNQAVYQRANMLRDHGMDPERRYWHSQIGFNYRMTNIQAAIGVAQLERVDYFIDKKRWIAEQYSKRLGVISNIKLPTEYGNVYNSYWLFTIELIGSLANERDDLLRRLTLNGIEARQVFIPLHDMPPYKKYIKTDSDFSVASRVSNASLSLPSSSKISELELSSVCDIIEAMDKRIKIPAL